MRPALATSKLFGTRRTFHLASMGSPWSQTLGCGMKAKARKLATRVLEEAAKRESAKEGVHDCKLSASQVMHIEPNLMGKEPEG